MHHHTDSIEMDGSLVERISDDAVGEMLQTIIPDVNQHNESVSADNDAEMCLRAENLIMRYMRCKADKLVGADIGLVLLQPWSFRLSMDVKILLVRALQQHLVTLSVEQTVSALTCIISLHWRCSLVMEWIWRYLTDWTSKKTLQMPVFDQLLTTLLDILSQDTTDDALFAMLHGSIKHFKHICCIDVCVVVDTIVPNLLERLQTSNTLRAYLAQNECPFLLDLFTFGIQQTTNCLEGHCHAQILLDGLVVLVDQDILHPVDTCQVLEYLSQVN